MASVGLQFDLSSIERLAKRVSNLADAANTELLYAVGAEVESQTRRRLQDEKTSPDGEPWKELTDNYADRKKGSGGILELEGDLIDSIDNQVDSGLVEVGSNLIYSAIHQEGGTDDMPAGPAAIEARPFLGLSDDNIDDLADLLDGFVDDHIREQLQ